MSRAIALLKFVVLFLPLSFNRKKEIPMKTTIYAQLILTILFLLNTSLVAQSEWKNVSQAQFSNDLNAVYFADAKRGWIGGDAGFLATTIDGGNSWIKLPLNTKNSISDIYFRNAEKGYLLAGGNVFFSADAGQSWREENILQTDLFGASQPELYSIRFSNKKNGWIVGSLNEGDKVVNSLVLHSEEEGAPWRRVRLETKNELIHLDFVNQKRGWIVGSNGTIFSTNDGGASWQKQNSNTVATLYHVDFKNENLGWVVGEKGLILRTEDGGANWQKVNSNVSKTLLTVEFTNEKSGWIAGRGGVILHSEDGGRTWTAEDAKTTSNIFAIFAQKKQLWAVGGRGTILRFER